MVFRLILVFKIICFCLFSDTDAKAQPLVDNTPHFTVRKLANGVFACIHVF